MPCRKIFPKRSCNYTAYNGSYKFASGVKVLPENTEAELTDENVITVYNCATDLAAGDKFGIVKDGFPSVFKVLSITGSSDARVIKVGRVATEEAFETLDIEGNIDGSLVRAQACSNDVEISYIVGGTEDKQYRDGEKYESIEELGDNEVSAIEAVIQCH